MKAKLISLTLLNPNGLIHLPESHVISPFGGARHHSGVDHKDASNDNICAALMVW